MRTQKKWVKRKGPEHRIGYIQDFHGESVHPPDVGVEDEVVHALPAAAVLVYRLGHDDAVQNAVHIRVVRVRFDEEWRPVKLDRGIIVLDND